MNRYTRIAASMAFTSCAAMGMVTASPSLALPPNCVEQYWLYGGLFGRGTTRTICDGPIQADGTWQRVREFYDGERYVPMRCSWGSYSGSCSGGYWLNEFEIRDQYVVSVDTVLPDEPGHLG